MLFAVIFFWTPPHFWALAIRYKDDYAAADVPMLPSVADFRTDGRAGSCATRSLLWALTLLFGPVAGMGPIYLVAAIVLGAIFTAHGRPAAAHARTPGSAMRLFSYSITYVTLLFAAMAVDSLVRGGLR